MKKVLILGDSLPLPRYKPELCLYNDTWPALIQKDYKVHMVAIGGGTIKDLYRQMEYHMPFQPDYVILQCGIVDCAPRALGKLELEVMQSLWMTKRLVLPLVKRQNRILREVRKKTYTPPKQFESFLGKIKKSLADIPVFSIGILPTCSEYERIVPGVTKRVEQYNDILLRFFNKNFISTAEIDRNGIMSDFIHLNGEGHQFISNKILSKLRE
jgi:hypothetical protein